MKGFVDNIERLTEENTAYRHAVYTGKYMQLVLMCIQPGEEIGAEVHEGHDQFIRIEAGTATLLIDDKRYTLHADDATIIPSGALHNLINEGDVPVKLYTLYSPPEHKHDTKQQTKKDEVNGQHFDGVTTE